MVKSRTIPFDERIMDPMFPIPDGMVGFKYEELQPDLEIGDEEALSSEVDADVIFEDDSSLDDESGAPQAPDDLTIVEQIIHMSSTGQQVVDVVVEVEDIPQAIKYEFRVVKY